MALTDEQKELIEIHGKDVELKPDDSEDEKLTEKLAIKQAKSENLGFRDFWTIEGDLTEYETQKQAEKKANGKPVIQNRVAVQL